jgi:uncharacterized protein YdbL (DUF1318 family)
MNRHTKSAILLAIFSLVLFTGVSWGDNIKTRMAKRLPVIKDLKARGIVGENNQGYLEYRKGGGEQKAVVDEENADRKLVYQAIAKKQGSSAEHVGRRRAMQIREKEDPGHWLQDEKGQWIKK